MKHRHDVRAARACANVRHSSRRGMIVRGSMSNADLNAVCTFVSNLFYDAWSHGVIGLHGVVPSHLIGDFSEKNCFFTCRGGWNVAHSRKPELLELLGNGDASLSRLDGDSCLN